MYQTNLSFAMLKIYLEFALSYGLMTQISENNKKFYETTEKGARFVEIYNSLLELIPALNEIGDF
jgi:predicted transcriptional regulator